MKKSALKPIKGRTVFFINLEVLQETVFKMFAKINFCNVLDKTFSIKLVNVTIQNMTQQYFIKASLHLNDIEIK